MFKILLNNSLITTAAFSIVSVSCLNKNDSYFKTYEIKSNINVIDGDTISFWENGQIESLRIFGIDCPETKKNNYQKLAKFENLFANKAKAFLNNQILRKNLFYRYITTDKYSRKVGQLFYYYNNEQIDVGLEIVRNGLARVKYINIDKKDIFTVRDADLKEYFYKLKENENFAKRNNLNIWSYNQSLIFSKQ
ncbi:thermonuclease family protein [Mycoplasmopsis felifaucium]|uniref:thermonuclease family protein n=1 Tax=Mycoplasmopsis felifaucium TaxID=35768 RepID=UPI00068A9496|nr:thermonuclease family protein [Mycoplasmopsis felifaucium]